jgi:hydroxylamine dehydrogenase
MDCYSCHRANEKDPATFEHYGHRIAVIVAPNYCGRCHGKEVEQFEKSHNAQDASL